MKYSAQLTDNVERLGKGISLVRNGALTYLEVTHSSPIVSYCKTLHIDVLPGGLVEALEAAKAWQHKAKLETERLRHHHNKEAKRNRYVRAKQAAVLSDRVEVIASQMEREIRNGAVVEAARNDVRGVWARYGPALDEHRYRVPVFQWF